MSVAGNSVDSGMEVELPLAKAARFFDKARQFYTLGGGTSVELERVVRELSYSTSVASKEPRHFYFMAKVFKQSLDYASAIYALRYVLRLDPNHLAAKKHLSELLMKHGQEKMSDAVLAQSRGLPAKHYEQAYNTARVFFDECLLLQKSNSRVWMFKGVCHANLREPNDAIEAISRAIHLLTIDVRVYVPWTDKRFENDSKGKTARQIAILGLQRKADKARHERNLRMLCEMHVLRGKLYWAAGMTDQGNKDLRLASTLQPEHPEVLAFGAQSFRKAEKMYNQAVSLIKEGGYEEALKLINMALEISADDIKLHITLSKVQRLQKNLPAAYSAIQRATQLFTQSSQFDMKVPEDITQETNLVFNDMAIMCAGRGEYEKAIALLNKVISSEKKLARGLSDINYRFYVNRGDCYRARHELQQAASDYLLGLQQKPQTDTEVWNIKTRLSLTYYLLATDYFNGGDFAPADAALTQAIANNARVSGYFAMRGTCRFYLGAYGEACEDYRRCLELDPGNEEVRAKLRQQFEKSAEGSGGESGLVGGDFGGLSSGSPSADTPSSGIIDVKAQVVESMSKLKATTSDVVEMMLNPRKVHNLPTIHKMVKSASNAALHAHTAAITAAPEPLPVVNPRLTTAFFASQDATAADHKMKGLLHAKYDTQKGPMWSAMTNAKKMAMARCKPAAQPESDAEKVARKTGKEKSYTSAGLKRYSEEMSKASMEKYKDDLSFIAGVITSYDDPFLLSGGAPTKKVNLVFKVANSGTRKKYQPAADTDTGVCDVIETEDSIVNLHDAERAAWRKLRAQGDGASVTDELIEQLTRPPPPRPPSSEADIAQRVGMGSGNHVESNLVAGGRPGAKVAGGAVSSNRDTYGMNKKTANKFAGAGGRGRPGGNRLRVRFVGNRDREASDILGETEADPAVAHARDAADFFGGVLGVSRVAQLLAETEGFDAGFGLQFGEEGESSLIALTEEEELKAAAEQRVKAELEEERRKRDARREEARKRLRAQGIALDSD